MDPPPLKLLMLQGPREGETLEFGVRSTVRVGRVVTGNNVTIKDAGISSKHVFIGFESGPAKEQNWKPELQQMSLRVTRSGKNLSVDCTAMEIDDNKIRRGARRGRPPRPEPLEIIQVDDSEDDKENVKESNLEERDSEEDKKKKDNDREPPPERARVDAVKENVKGLTMQEDNCKEDINQSEHGVPKSSNKEEETLDLEKMTLGQWFDYMEVHLQKQIVEETEVLIEGMRQKAEQVHAYKMQQKKKRAKEKEKDKDVVLVNNEDFIFVFMAFLILLFCDEAVIGEFDIDQIGVEAPLMHNVENMLDQSLQIGFRIYVWFTGGRLLEGVRPTP
ncbi:FHA domain-containing protein [Tripterygium wilfordii]|uniref:FHA domain-containing protein n=1 Tax=Tripterygium wilfordii TaxID=458696 RepID=A0A7J7CXA2_TRIWF|nr:FHA domain-containing protein [Tripterygium wilfordii]